MPGPEYRVFDPGDRLGRYVVVERVGAGAWGAIYRARDEVLERDVALKVAHDVALSKRLLQREARMLAALGHPALLRVLDVGVHEGVPYSVHEWMARNLVEELEERDWRLPWAACRDLGVRVGAALDYVHRRGYVHGDVKPRTIFISAFGEYLLPVLNEIARG